MTTNKRSAATLATLSAMALLGTLAVPATAMAQAYPSKPVRIVVGFAPGGGVAINARLLSPRLAGFPGQSVIFGNKPGAGPNLATAFVPKPPPPSRFASWGASPPAAAWTSTRGCSPPGSASFSGNR